MGFKMMGGKSPKAKTGAGIPLNMKSPLYKTDDPTDPVKKPKKSTKPGETLHPGYDKTTFGKAYKGMEGSDTGTQVINTLSKRDFPKDSIQARKVDLATRFPKKNMRMASSGDLKDYIAQEVNSETGDYAISHKDDSRKTAVVSRRDVKMANNYQGYVPKIESRERKYDESGRLDIFKKIDPSN